MAIIDAKAGGHRYPIVIGTDCGDRLRTLVRRHLEGGRLFVLYDAQFFALHGRNMQRILGAAASRDRELVIPVGETAKSASTLAGVYDFLLDARISRDDLILACGGGVTTDLAGYAAATALRGVRWAVVPTTLLGMVDAAIGGKTGINHPKGKNLIGVFCQPEFVHCDLQYLRTLDRRHMVAGLGEVIKYAGLCGNRSRPHGMLDTLERMSISGDFYDLKKLSCLVQASVTYKVMIVERDERDLGVRIRLNYGHTFAHAVEQSLGYGHLLHGEAVILGVIAALNLGKSYGFISRGLARYQAIAESFVRFLPKRTLRPEAIRAAMAIDKKRSNGQTRFVLIERLGRPILSDNVDRRLIDSALADMVVCYSESGGRDASNPRR
jgi:3-dehydroquinate synthase